jgi:hypothetical protein
VDAGLKAMATDAGPPTVVGHNDGVTYHFFGDEHGLVIRGVGPRSGAATDWTWSRRTATRRSITTTRFGWSGATSWWA